MLNRFLALMTWLLGAALVFSSSSFAQSNPKGWPDPKENRQPVAEKDKKPAPKHSIAGLWANTREGNQAKGVQLHPNDGKPENQPPYTPHGLELYKSHKALEGFDAVGPAYQ